MFGPESRKEFPFVVPFTQYLLPRGEKQSVYLPVDKETFKKAQEITEAGYQFEIEVLRTGEVSATIMDPILEMDAAITVGLNDASCPQRSREMIMNFQPRPKAEREKEA